MRKVRRQTFVLIIFLSGIALFCWTYLQQDVDNKIKIELIERSVRSAANTGECRSPDLPLYSPEIMKFYKPVKKIDCGNVLDDWVKCEKSICYVKPEIVSSHGDVVCSYTDLIRKTDYKSKYGKSTKTKEPYVLQKSDFAKVSCYASNTDSSWFGLVCGIRDKVKHTPVANVPPIDAPLGFGDESLVDAPAFFNILMFGFDSLSRNAFIRKLPKSYKYLTEQLNATILKGYNIIGDGTPQALIPLLTGYTELELPETRKRMSNANNVDVYPMIWKDYAKYGYITSFNEDIPSTGTFTYRMKGFNEQPVHHYLRTFYVEAENILSSSEKNCIGNQPDHKIMLDYTKNFVLKYNEEPNFIFSFHGGLSHDSINLIGAADDDVVEWLHTLREKHVLDNTILILMADHGNRFSAVRETLQGKLEERLPFFSFVFPESFKKRFPQRYQNFVTNSDKLSTPFDVHATLKHLLELQNPKSGSQHDFNTKEPEFLAPYLSNWANKRAISLFDIVPKNRSCADAYIEPHWCACLNWERLPTNDSAHFGTLLKMAASIVDTINNATNQHRKICANLELKKINWAMRLMPHKEILQFKGAKDRDGYVADMSETVSQNEEIYQLQIVVSPGDSLFEASVTHNLRTFTTMTQLSEISRINKYGSQANCIYERDPELRKYCYCT